ncbi:hypothetical protein D3C81_930320 [compost metagenome]
MQLGDLDARLHAQGRVEVRQRLVEQEHFRVAHDGAADGHALALAARQFLRRALQVFAQIEDGGRLVDFLADDGRIDTGQLQRERHVLEHRHVRVQRIRLEHHRQVALGRWQGRDVAPVERQLAAVDRFQARDQAQQGRLAAAGRSHEDDELALLDFQVDALDGAVLAKEFFDIAQLKVGHDSLIFKLYSMLSETVASGSSSV